MSRIIGLAGRSGSGKDTTALEFQRFGYTPIALADDVKVELAALHRLPLSALNGHRTKEMRDLLISYAEGQRALHGEDYWARRLAIKIEQLRNRNIVRDVVVPDVRKQVEVDAIVAAGGQVYSVIATSRLRSNGATDELIAYEAPIDHLTGLSGSINNEIGAAVTLETQVKAILGMRRTASLFDTPEQTSTVFPFVTGA